MTTNTTRLEKHLLVFDLNSEFYGVDIGSVREIIRMQRITRVPQTPDFVEGMINLRGKITPVVDLRRRFGFPVGELTVENRIVVVDAGQQNIGVVVDAVTEVLRTSADSMETLSPVITAIDADELMGIVKLEDRLIILLDLHRVLSQREKDALPQLWLAAD